MALLKYMLGFRDFSKVEEIKHFINLNLFYDKLENVTDAEHLLLFSTEKQKTWIILSNYRMFCVLDDVSKDTFAVRWHLDKSEILRNNEIILDIQVDENYSGNSGSIDFGRNHRKWLYSKNLFPSKQNLLRSLREIIGNAMSYGRR